MSRDQALAFLLSRLDYERTPLPYGERTLKLARMRELLARLGNPQERYPAVHIAGTKGKGSTAAMLAAILSEAGHRTGLYTSPHLARVEERIAVGGQECTGEEFAGLVERVAPIVKEMDAMADRDGEGEWRPTFFEVVTALAMLYFADQKVDMAVLEVGLGGRLDSTNVCRPAVCLITSISFDHMQQLGHTLGEIAREKAGILKPGVPGIVSVSDAEPLQAIRQVAAEIGAPLIEQGIDFTFAYRPPTNGTHEAARADFRCRDGAAWQEWRDVPLGLVGRHQAANAAAAVAAVVELRRQGWRIPDSALLAGLAGVRWPARVEVIGRRPTVVLDSAHNRVSMEALVATLDESFAAPGQRRVAVFAVSRDKDLAAMLEVLLPAFDHVVFTRYASNPRSVSPEDLRTMAEGIQGKSAARCGITLCPELAQVPAVARSLAGPSDLICITGSIFIAGELRGMFEGKS